MKLIEIVILAALCACLVVALESCVNMPGWLVGLAGIIMGVCFACMLILGIYSRLALEPKRTKRTESVADTLGMRFSPRGESWLEKELSSLEVFSVVGRGGKSAKNMMHGEKEGVEVSIFEYHQTGYDISYEFTVARFASEKLDLPDFELGPKLPLGPKGIDFPSHPEFSKACCLQGKDDAAIRDTFFRDEVLTFFEGQRDIWLTGHGSRLFFCRGYAAGEWFKVEPAQIPHFLEEGLQICSLLGG